MTKAEHIQYWVDAANYDWTESESLFRDGHYNWSLFLAHLVLEKLLKALWVKNHQENTPPRIHLLHSLADQAGLQVSEETAILLRNVNSFAIEARYPDQKFSFLKRCTQEFAQEHLDKIREVRQWLLSLLQN